MMTPQTHWRFLHEGAFMRDSFEIRQSINPILVEAGVNVADYAVKQSERSLGLIARTPQASQALESRMADVFQIIATLAGHIIPVDIKSTPVAIAPAPMTLYTVPTLVVAKGRKSWDEWRVQDLSDIQKLVIKESIRSDIEAELKAWGIDWEASGLHLIDAGRPMVLSKQGPRGMARLIVRFVAPWRIEGELLIGHLPYLGNGIVKRGGQVHSVANPSSLST